MALQYHDRDTLTWPGTFRDPTAFTATADRYYLALQSDSSPYNYTVRPYSLSGSFQSGSFTFNHTGDLTDVTNTLRISDFVRIGDTFYYLARIPGQPNRWSYYLLTTNASGGSFTSTVIEEESTANALFHSMFYADPYLYFFEIQASGAIPYRRYNIDSSEFETRITASGVDVSDTFTVADGLFLLGRYYIADYIADSIRVFTLSGTTFTELADESIDYSDLTSVDHLATDGTNIYLFDSPRARRYTDVIPPPELDSPTLVSLRSGDAINVKWTTNDVSITDYDIEYKVSSHQTYTGFPFTGTETSARIGGLTPGTSYDIRVRASNSGGIGDWSVHSTISTLSKPLPQFTGFDSFIEKFDILRFTYEGVGPPTISGIGSVIAVNASAIRQESPYVDPDTALIVPEQGFEAEFYFTTPYLDVATGDGIVVNSGGTLDNLPDAIPPTDETYFVTGVSSVAGGAYQTILAQRRLV